MNFLFKDLEQLAELKRKRQQKLPAISLEDILFRIQVHSVKANLERVKITKDEFIALCRGVKKECLQQPGLLKIDSPIYVCTGTLGNYQEMANVIDRCGHPKFMNYLFLGDYAGKADQSLQCLVAMFAYRLFNPHNFFLLRGCHETIAMAKSYNLPQHLQDYFKCSTPWLQVCQAFCSLPYAAVIDDRAFCVHGGISPHLQSLDMINTIPRPLDVGDHGLACDLLWSDPTQLYDGWTLNDRGISVAFGGDIVHTFTKSQDISIICRGHEVPYQGYRYFADKKLVTINSCAQFGGILNNCSAVMMVDDHSNLLVKLISDRDMYNGQEKEEGMTFLEMVNKKKEREKKAVEDEKRESEKREEKLRRNRERKRLMIVK